MVIPRMHRRGQQGLLLALTFTVAGCESALGTGNVSGRVLFKGQPVPAGMVTFLGADGRAASGQIQEDGRYAIEGVPACDVTILVDSRPPSPVVIGRGKIATTPARKTLPIPARYGDAGEGGLKYTVRRGDQKHDILLGP